MTNCSGFIYFRLKQCPLSIEATQAGAIFAMPARPGRVGMSSRGVKRSLGLSSHSAAVARDAA
jgi:hypothetical protein